MSIRRKAVKIGILGGTFDPFHNGHLRMAEEAVKGLLLDRILIIPAGNPYFKGKITPYELRRKMVKAAFRDHDLSVFTVSDLEADTEKPTYTYLTLKRIHELYPGSPLYFICGEDVFSSLPSWKCPEEILSEAVLAVFRRSAPEEDPEDKDLSFYEKGKESLKRIFPGAECVFLEADIPAVSSTLIRERVLRGEDMKDLVPEGVEKIIRKNRLYME